MLFLKQCITHSRAMLLMIVCCIAAIQPVIGQQWRIGYSSFMGVGLQSENHVLIDNGSFGNQYLRGKSSSLVGFYGIYQPRQWMWMAQLQFSRTEQRFEDPKFVLNHPFLHFTLSAAYPIALGRSMQLSPFLGATFQYYFGGRITDFSGNVLRGWVTYRKNDDGKAPLENYSTTPEIQIEPRVGFMFRPNLVHPFWKRINIMSYAQFATEPLSTGSSFHSKGELKFDPAFTQIMLGIGIDIFQLKKKKG